MTDLNTEWMGLSLRTPLVVAASPLSDDLPMLEKLVAAGAGAVVMRSLFEEQIAAEQMAIHRHIDAWVDTNAEARSFLPDRNLFPVGMEPYLAQLKQLRARLDVPVLASLNGATPGGWTDLAQELESAGAAAIELNLYDICTDPGMSGAEVEDWQLETVREVVNRVSVPVSIKLSPLLHVRARLRAAAGGRGGRRCRGVQPLLPARRAARQPGPGHQASPFHLRRTAYAPACPGVAAWPCSGSAGGDGRHSQRP